MTRSPTRFAILCVALAACAPARGPAGRAPLVDAGVAQAQADSARLPYSAADVTFMTDMIGHHAQAIQISRWVPTHGADSSMRILAARIINAQTDDITLMRTWLHDRGKPVPSVDANGVVSRPVDPNDEHAGHDMGHTMAGMLTPEMLTELDAARGEAFEILFLQRMINHHRGAVSMVQTLIRSHGSALDETVFRFAAEVEVDQSTEIRRMLQMLLEKGGIPPD